MGSLQHSPRCRIRCDMRARVLGGYSAPRFLKTLRRSLLKLAEVHRETDDQLAIRIASREAEALTGEIDSDPLSDLVFDAGKGRPGAFQASRPLIDRVDVRRQMPPGAG